MPPLPGTWMGAGLLSVVVGGRVGLGVGLWRGTTAVSVRLQPPARAPPSHQESSTTYRLHVPLGSWPLKALRAVAPEGSGAGAGKKSAIPPSRSVGRYLPDWTEESVSSLGASSSKVRVTSERPEPPASDIRRRLCPLGATSRTSSSPANLCDRSYSVT